MEKQQQAFKLNWEFSLKELLVYNKDAVKHLCTYYMMQALQDSKDSQVIPWKRCVNTLF